MQKWKHVPICFSAAICYILHTIELNLLSALRLYKAAFLQFYTWCGMLVHFVHKVAEAVTTHDKCHATSVWHIVAMYNSTKQAMYNSTKQAMYNSTSLRYTHSCIHCVVPVQPWSCHTRNEFISKPNRIHPRKQNKHTTNQKLRRVCPFSLHRVNSTPWGTGICTPRVPVPYCIEHSKPSTHIIKHLIMEYLQPLCG
jgi:hypothetical protein